MNTPNTAGANGASRPSRSPPKREFRWSMMPAENTVHPIGVVTLVVDGESVDYFVQPLYPPPRRASWPSC